MSNRIYDKTKALSPSERFGCDNPAVSAIHVRFKPGTDIPESLAVHMVAGPAIVVSRSEIAGLEDKTPEEALDLFLKAGENKLNELERSLTEV